MESILQNKKLYISLGVGILLIGIAAFVAGRMLNERLELWDSADPMAAEYPYCWMKLPPRQNFQAQKLTSQGCL
jgi:hypothetical protein